MKLRSVIERIIGVVIIDDELVEKCRRDVMARCSTIDVAKYRRRQAQDAIAAEAKLAIADAFSERTGTNHVVGRSWPDAFAIIKGSYALVEIDIGLDYTDQGDGIEPVRVEVFRSVKKTGLSAMLDTLLRERRHTLDLTEKAEPKTPPPAAAAKPSRARSILDR